MSRKLLLGLLLFSFIFLTGMDYPESGSDYNSYRCIGGLVTKGNPISDVIEKCGEPMREDKIDAQPHRILIYQFDHSHVYYFAFLRDKLKRIKAVSCQKDPNCQ
jgi:hypothetical protein